LTPLSEVVVAAAAAAEVAVAEAVVETTEALEAEFKTSLAP